MLSGLKTFTLENMFAISDLISNIISEQVSKQKLFFGNIYPLSDSGTLPKTGNCEL